MATEFGGKIRLQGESEYRSSLSAINSELRLLSKEMEANGQSAENLSKKQELTNKKIAEQKKYVTELEKALEAAKSKYGENSTEVQKWETKLNNAKGTLINMEKELADMSDKMKQYSAAFENVGNKFDGWANKLSGLSAGAAAGLSAMAGLAVKAGATADDLNTLSSITGVSTNELQKFAYASDIIDVSLDTFTGSLAKLVRNMQSAQQGSKTQVAAFEALGVAYKNTDGSLRNNQEVFYELIDALSAVENETQRDAYAMSLFGKSAQDLNPLIKGGSETLKKLGEEAESAGLILSQDALDGLNQFNDGVDRLKAMATADISRLGSELAPTLLPVLEEMTNGLEKVVNWFVKLDEKQIETGLKATAFVAVLAPLTKGLASVATAASTLFSVCSTAGISIGAITAASTALSPILASLGTAYALSASHAEKMRGENWELYESMVNLKNSYDNSIDSINNNLNLRAAEADAAARLVPELENLSEKTDLTAQEDERLNTIIAQLNTAMPDLNLAIDEQTGKLNKNISEVRNAIQAYKDLAEATAYRDKLQTTVSTRLEFEENFKDFGKSINKYYEALVREKGQDAVNQWGDLAFKVNTGKKITENDVLSRWQNGNAWDEKLSQDLLNYVYQYQELQDLIKAEDDYAAKLAERAKAQEKAAATTSTANTGGTSGSSEPPVVPDPPKQTAAVENVKKNDETAEEFAKKAYASQQEKSFAWIDNRILLNDFGSYNTNEADSYNRIYQRAKEAYESEIISLDEFTAEIEKISQERLTDYKKKKTQFSNFIADRDFYGDWEQYNTNEEEILEKMLANADYYYQRGVLSYEEYLNEIRELNKSIYSAQLEEQETMYQQTENRLNQQLADKKAEMDAEVSRLNQQVSNLRSKYEAENKQKKLSELQTEADLYRNAGTIAGQEHYKELVGQIETIKQEEEIAALERKNNEIIMRLEAEYAALEAEKTSILTQIEQNTRNNAQNNVLTSLGGILGGIVKDIVSVVNNTTNNNTNNVTQNNNINDKVDIDTFFNFIKKM